MGGDSGQYGTPSRDEAIVAAMQCFDEEDLGIDRDNFEFNHATFELYEKKTGATAAL